MNKVNIIELLQTRGFIYQCTNLNVLKKLCNNKIVLYVGFDCTANFLHIGSLLQIMMLRHIQNNNHKVIILLGGGTTKIGDPSGKDKARQMLSDSQINNNKISIKNVFAKFLMCNTGNHVLFLDNNYWLSQIKYLKFLKDFGSCVSVNRILSFENIKLRLNKQRFFSFLEFNYMLLQAYDFYVLFKKYNCILQLGGSDQWANIISGVELIKKKTQNEVFGLTTPILTTSSGKKMGKSEHGALWLNSNLLSSYDYWQFWRNIEDNNVVKFLKWFTEISVHDISCLKRIKNINKLKIILADNVTALLFGIKESEKAKKNAYASFLYKEINKNLLTIIIQAKDLKKDIFLHQLIFYCGLTISNSRAKYLIYNNGIKLNNINVSNKKFTCNLILGKYKCLKLSVGKKNHVFIKIQNQFHIIK